MNRKSTWRRNRSNSTVANDPGAGTTRSPAPISSIALATLSGPLPFRATRAPFFEEGLDDSAADPARAAGHQHSLAGKVQLHLDPSSISMLSRRHRRTARPR
jgi:hypothetical protein